MKILIFIFFLCGSACATAILASGETADTDKELDGVALALPILLAPSAYSETNPAKWPPANAGADPVVFDEDYPIRNGVGVRAVDDPSMHQGQDFRPIQVRNAEWKNQRKAHHHQAGRRSHASTP